MMSSDTNRNEAAEETGAGTAEGGVRASTHFLAPSRTYMPRPLLVPSSRSLVGQASGSQLSSTLRHPPTTNTNTNTNTNINMPQSASSTARKGRSATSNPFLPWGVRGDQVRFPRSRQLDETFLDVAPPPERTEAEHQQQGTIDKIKAAFRGAGNWVVGIMPGWPEPDTVQNILYALIFIALANAIAAIATLKRANNATEDELTTLWLWVIVSVVVLVFILAFNNHRDAQIQESGGARHHDHRWVELGDLDTQARATAPGHHNYGAGRAQRHPRDRLPLPVAHIPRHQPRVDESQASREATADPEHHRE
ncbi:hypothetical protein F5Y06DRAFT_305248 [Hypoxylon sp. FL0890]|nr:hypothetical protein F5Y06DRAFT_305248 [Hypoxylon sp. FL0890]